MKFFYFFLLVSFTISYSQTQIGADIDGEATNDYSGYSVSLSSDGSVVAIGSYYNDGNNIDSGSVRVYRNISGIWTKIGADIDGEAAGDASGISISLSADGTILAIGAHHNSGNGTYSGSVRVYKNITGIWTKIGADIDGEAAYDKSAYSVSLSSDGSTVAIGARGNDGNGTDAGSVRVYKNVSGIWTKIGADIDGEAANDFSGFSISLSSNGTVVAIGAPYNNGNGALSGSVRVYKNISGIWTKIGGDIDGEAANDHSGYRVSLSSDGSIVAIQTLSFVGSLPNSGSLRVYKNVYGTWSQIGVDIDAENGINGSGGISISSNTNALAIGYPYNNGSGVNAGSVRIFDLTSILSSNSFVLSKFYVFPNPASNILNIFLEENIQLEKVNIYNTLGQLIKTEKNNIINVSTLAKGNYYFEVITNKGKATKTILIQ